MTPITALTKCSRRPNANSGTRERSRTYGNARNSKTTCSSLRLVARLSGADVAEVRELLDAVSDGLRTKVTASLASDYVEAGRSTSHDDVSAAMKAAVSDVLDDWDTLDSRLAMCPAKDVIRGLNREFGQRKLQPVSAETLAAELRRPEIATEMRTLVLEVDRACRGYRSEELSSSQ